MPDDRLDLTQFSFVQLEGRIEFPVRALDHAQLDRIERLLLRVDSKLNIIIGGETAILRKENAMAVQQTDVQIAVAALTAEVADDEAAEVRAETLLNGISDRINALITPRTDPDTVAQINHLLDTLSAEKKNLIAATATGDAALTPPAPPPVNGQPAAPTVTSVSPASGKAGDTITISGTGFDAATSGSIGGVAISPHAGSDTSLDVVVPVLPDPAFVGQAAVVITGPGGDSNNDQTFTYVAQAPDFPAPDESAADQSAG